MKTTFMNKFNQSAKSGLRTLALGIAATVTVFAAGQAFAGSGAGRHPIAKASVEAIKAADTNNDGQISAAEAQAKLPRVAKHFSDLDTNNDGQISAVEFKAANAKARAKHGAKMDTDKDGFVSRAEAEDHAPRLAKHFDKIDMNKDGKLSREEIQAVRAKKHKKA